MTAITDNNGQTWTLSMNVNTLRRVKSLCGVNLTEIVTIEPGKQPNTALLEQLASDPILLVDVLYAVVKPEADAKGITDEAFGAAMVGDAIEQAVNALLDEVINFFPSPKRKVLTRLIQAGRRFAKKQEEALTELLESPTLDEAIESALTESSDSVTNSAESSGSTPAL